MGREIRRVPADWEHPCYTEDDAPGSDRVGTLRPLYDNGYANACEEWYREAAAWTPEKSASGARWYHEYAGDPPDEDSYRARTWTAEEATHYQVYETVSEGTPVTPHFATQAELVDYLVEHGDFWDQRRRAGGWARSAAEQFVGAGWAPTMIAVRTGDRAVVLEPRDGGPPA